MKPTSLFFSTIILLFISNWSVGQCPKNNTCTPGNADDYKVGNGIFNVSLNTINNSTSGVEEGYKDFSCNQSTSLTVGASYNISIKTGDTYNENVRVWIDYNDNGTFETTELAFSSDNQKLHTGSFSPPASAVVGQTLRMRVSADFQSAPANACTTPTYSQVEDYGILLVDNSSAPVADFFSSDTVTCSGIVNFKDKSVNIPTAWLWDFGDGTSSTLQNPSHTYAADGSYEVKLTVTNSKGSNTKTKSDYVIRDGALPKAASCTPITASYCCLYGISKVEFGRIRNSSGDGSKGYEDFTCVGRTKLSVSKSYVLSVTTSGTEKHDVKAWLDFNNDGVFDNTTELVMSALSSINPTSIVNIPATAVTDKVLRLRIIADFEGSMVGPCISPYRGQAEDYSVTITSSLSAPIVYFESDSLVSCVGTFKFIDKSENAPSSWLWEFGDGTTSSLANPTHTYSKAGYYNVKLKSCNQYGCDTLTKKNLVQYIPVCYCKPKMVYPNANYLTRVQLNTIDNTSSSNVMSGFTGYTNFTNFSTDLTQGVEYKLKLSSGYYYSSRVSVWIDYNMDGAFSINENIALNSYASEIKFTIPYSTTLGKTRMRIIAGPSFYSYTDICGYFYDYGETEDYTINILPNTTPPSINFYSLNNIGCNATVQFKDTSLYRPTSWFWNFGDGSTSTLQNPSHTYSSYGQYNVTLQACNDYGCNTVTKNKFVDYSDLCSYCDPSIAGYAYYYISSVKLNTINNTTLNSPNNYSLQKDTTTLTKGNDYLLEITASYSGSIVAWLDYNRNGQFESTESLNYSTYSNGFKVKFKIPTTATTGKTRLRIVYSYYYNNYSDNACISQYNGEVEDYFVTIAPLSSPPKVNFFTNDTITCNSQISLVDTSQNSPNSYLWDFGDGSTSTLENPTHSYKAYGNYDIKLKSCNAFGCDSLTKKQLINYSSDCNYCLPNISNSYYYITNVNLDSSLIQSSANDGYSNYSYLSANLKKGIVHNLKIITNNYWYNSNLNVWIDYNQDGVFDLDEKVFNNVSINSNFKSNFRVPDTAKTGKTRMRIMVSYYQVIGSCDYISGEVEDYSVVIQENTEPPKVNFYTLDTVNCTGIVSFVDTTDHIPTSYYWSFGDGETSSLSNPVHTYKNYGKYTVSLKACNQYGCDSISKQKLVNYSDKCRYCESTSTNSYYYANYFISSVEINTLKNVASSIPTKGYSDYTYLSTDLTQGRNYALKLNSGYYYSGYFLVYIDYNQNGVFENIEIVSNYNSYSNQLNTTVRIPEDAKLGSTRMRIQFVNYYFGLINQSCNLNVQGETEDYSVNIIKDTAPPSIIFYSKDTTTCSSNITLVDSINGSVSSYLWDYGDGTSDTLSTHSYSQYGNYTIKLKACNTNGCDSVIKKKYINYSSKCPYCTPVSNYYNSYYISKVKIGNINNSSSYNVSNSTYQDFSSISANLLLGNKYTISITGNSYSGYYYVFIDYDQDGIFEPSEQLVNNYLYNYTLTTSITIPNSTTTGKTRMRIIYSQYYLNNACYVSYGEAEDYTLNISPSTVPPFTEFTTTDTTTCNGKVVFGDSTTNSPTSWLWNFGDGTTSTLRNPSHQYAKSGTYSVSLKTCNQYGCDSLTKRNFIVFDSLSCLYCKPSYYNYTYSSYIKRVFLDSIDNTTNYNGYTNYAQSTTFSVGTYHTLRVDANYANVYPARLMAWIDFDKDGDFTLAENVLNTSSYKPGASVQASFLVPSTATIGLTKMRVRIINDYYSNSSSVNYVCDNYLAGETEDYAINIIGNSTPPKADFYTPTRNGCRYYFEFEDRSENSPTTWLWDFGDGSSSSLQHPIYQYANPGNYDIQLIACNQLGCDTVKRPSHISITSSCACVLPTNSYTYTYTDDAPWIDGIQLGNIGNSSGVDKNNYGNYTNMYLNADHGSTISFSLNIGDNNYSYSYNQATFWLDINKNGQYESQEQLGLFYTVGNIISGNITLPTLSDDLNTTLRIVVMDYYSTSTNCPQYSISGEIEDYSININVPPSEKKAQLNIYPNPTSSYLAIDYKIFVMDKIQLTVWNALGEIVIDREYKDVDSIYETLDVSFLRKGVYILKLTSSKGNEISKFVKE